MESFSWKTLWKIIKRTGRAAAERGEIPSVEALGQYRRDLLNNGSQCSISSTEMLGVSLPFRTFSLSSIQSLLASAFNLYTMYIWIRTIDCSCSLSDEKIARDRESKNKDACYLCIHVDQNHASGKLNRVAKFNAILNTWASLHATTFPFLKIVSRKIFEMKKLPLDNRLYHVT